MQYAKDEIRGRIIDAARAEFLEKGFERASVRTITARARTSKSNLYNYFQDKDRLFYAVLEPTLTQVYQGLEAAKIYNAPKSAAAYTRDSQKFVVTKVMEFVFNHMTDLKLLLFNAQGSSLANFKDRITDAFTGLLCEWVESIQPQKEISRFFIGQVAGLIIGGIEQTIKSGVTPEQVETHQDEFVAFLYHGWQGVFHIKEGD
jgi:AcrR family transcriptional regulator